MTVTTKFEIGQIVYVKNDTEQRDHYVIEIILSLNQIKYKLRGEYSSEEYYEFELSQERNTLKTVL